MVFACTARHVLRRSLPMQQQIRNKSSAATSVWEGTLKEGGGVMTSQTGAITNMVLINHRIYRVFGSNFEL